MTGFTKQITAQEWCEIELTRHLTQTPYCTDRNEAIETLIGELDEKNYGLTEKQQREAEKVLRAMMEPETAGAQ